MKCLAFFRANEKLISFFFLSLSFWFVNHNFQNLACVRIVFCFLVRIWLEEEKNPRAFKCHSVVVVKKGWWQLFNLSDTRKSVTIFSIFQRDFPASIQWFFYSFFHLLFCFTNANVWQRCKNLHQICIKDSMIDWSICCSNKIFQQFPISFAPIQINWNIY